MSDVIIRFPNDFNSVEVEVVFNSPKSREVFNVDDCVHSVNYRKSFVFNVEERCIENGVSYEIESV